MSQVKKVRRWIQLGGLALRLWIYVFYARRGQPKIVFLQSHYTISAGKTFRGEVLEENYVLKPGWILGWRRGTDGKPIWYHVRSLYDLVRSFAHALASEWRAQARSEVCIDTAIVLVRDLLAYWPLTPTDRRALNAKLGELESELEYAQTQELQDAEEAVLDAVGFQDVWGRPNPQASAAKLFRARRLITIRLGEIISIVPSLTRLQVLVTQELARIDRTFLERDLATLQMVQDALAQCTQERHLVWVAKCLRQVQETCQSIQVAPFYANARHMEKEIRSALAVLETRCWTVKNRARTVYRIVRVMIHSLAFKRAQRELEKLIRELSMRLSVRGGSLTLFQCETLAKKVERYAVQARKLNERYFKHKHLRHVRTHLAHAVRFLRAEKPKQAKKSLKAASAWL